MHPSTFAIKSSINNYAIIMSILQYCQTQIITRLSNCSDKSLSTKRLSAEGINKFKFTAGTIHRDSEGVTTHIQTVPDSADKPRGFCSRGFCGVNSKIQLLCHSWLHNTHVLIFSIFCSLKHCWQNTFNYQVPCLHFLTTFQFQAELQFRMLIRWWFGDHIYLYL